MEAELQIPVNFISPTLLLLKTARVSIEGNSYGVNGILGSTSLSIGNSYGV